LILDHNTNFAKGIKLENLDHLLRMFNAMKKFLGYIHLVAMEILDYLFKWRKMEKKISTAYYI
jgi:hypothetical protein